MAILIVVGLLYLGEFLGGDSGCGGFLVVMVGGISRLLVVMVG